jgi:hypothetical protein
MVVCGDEARLTKPGDSASLRRLFSKTEVNEFYKREFYKEGCPVGRAEIPPIEPTFCLFQSTKKIYSNSRSAIFFDNYLV